MQLDMQHQTVTQPHFVSPILLQLIAKCETRQSLFNFKAIAQEADAIMLSRGNLGLDVLPEKMALVQKHVIQQCNMLGKPAIVTRVVDTMISSPRPTRYSKEHDVVKHGHSL